MTSDINIDVEDLKRIGTAPLPLRIITIMIGCAVVLGLIFHFLIQPQRDKLRTVQAKEQELRIKFDTEQSKAANRSAYVEQLEEMKKTFNVMLRQLPNKTDIESLLVDLSQTSVASGLEVKYFKPQSEVPREFYAEYPIEIQVSGQYHQFGQFISGLAALPRIVTLNGINIEDLKQRSTSARPSNMTGELKMELVATTYRYLEEDE
ncbi:MAG: pilus assembly protein PilO [Gammaproteobacteria bacterium]|nr:MAG: pilus assembly protein PilO [Gammaproteobacteria bacterium]PIE37186.1 MAG: pilus assembly protein PilO [Gammaproteobacteria bacterium]